MLISEPIRKYPRTAHVRGSRLQHGDHDIDAVPWSQLAMRHLVIEEKMDGANCGISFAADGTMLLQSRGHYLMGGPRERHFSLLKQWAASIQEELYCALGHKYVMYGEWLYAKHTIFYDALPHYFMEFDVMDKEDGAFLDTPSRRALLRDVPVVPVRVIQEGKFVSLSELGAMIGRSNFISDMRDEALAAAAAAAGVSPASAAAHTDPSLEMEGLYIKHEEGGRVVGRYKYVRASFTSEVLEQEQHWLARPIIPNRVQVTGENIV